MPSRAPPRVETTESCGDVLRTYEGVTEAVSLQIRYLNEVEGDVKLIWWFVAAVVEEEEEEEERGPGEEQFQVGFYGYADAVRMLTFQMDREMVEKAIRLVEVSCS